MTLTNAILLIIILLLVWYILRTEASTYYQGYSDGFEACSEEYAGLFEMKPKY